MSINKFNEDYLDKFLSLLSKEKKFCIIMGNVSIDLSKQNINGAITDFYYELMCLSFFVSYILQTTRVAFAIWKFCQQSFWPLHTVLVIKKFCNSTPRPQQKITKRCFSRFNDDELKNELKNKIWNVHCLSSNDININSENFL